MDWYLLMNYKKLNKSKIDLNYLGKSFWTKIGILYAIIIALIVYSTINQNFFASSLVFFLCAIVSIIFNKHSSKIYISKASSDLLEYKNKLQLLREILKEMEIDSEKQIEYLIELISENKKGWKLSDGIFRPAVSALTLAIIPLLFILLNWIFNKSDSINNVFLITGIVLSFFLAFVGLIYLIYPIFKSYSDKEYLDYCSLQGMLQDILLLDFKKNHI